MTRSYLLPKTLWDAFELWLRHRRRPWLIIGGLNGYPVAFTTPKDTPLDTRNLLARNYNGTVTR